MTLPDIINNAITPALDILGMRRAAKSDVMMLAIGLQESRFEHRYQVVSGGGKGPARSFWQMERGGGVRGVLSHAASSASAITLCRARGVPVESGAVWAAIEHDDVLAAGFARLLLLTDPRPLPAINDPQAAWDCYIFNWRPGKPHRETWDQLHAQAVAAVV